MSNTTSKIFVDKMGGRSAEQYIGQSGELFYDPEVGELRLSDGETPGGNPITTGGGGGNTTPAPVLVSALGSASTAGMGARKFVSNANSRTFGAIVAAGDGTNTVGTTTSYTQGNMDFANFNVSSSGGGYTINITMMGGGSPSALLTALQAGVPNGSTITTGGGMSGSPSVFTLTSTFTYDAMAGGGTGAWVATANLVSGSSSPMVNQFSITTPTTFTVPVPVYSDGTDWRIG